MICFRDMTFCNAECSNTSCRQNLSDKVKQDAAKWWGGDDAPVAVSDFSKDCKDYKP